MKVKEPKKYPLADALLKLLKDKSSNLEDGGLYSIYLHIFKMLLFEELEDVLSIYKDIYKGKDEFFKKDGKTQWFVAFHKSIRQCDFFRDSYRKGNIDILTSAEKKEFNYLISIVQQSGYNKEGQAGQLFNDQYRRYLQLHERKRAEKRDVSIGGHLDMILYNTIDFDKTGVLRKALISVFDNRVRLYNDN